MLTGQLTIPPLFHINREEIINPAKQIEQVVQKQQIEYREVELNPPNQTLYVNRLNEKVQVDDMRVSLYALFSNVGKVIDVVVKKNILMRGQAFVLMESIEQAKEAQERYHNYTLYEKPMKVNFAKTRSDFFTKQDGTYEEKEKLPMSDRIKEHKKKIHEKRIREMMNSKTQREAPTISMPLPDQRYHPMPQKQKQTGNQPNKVLFVEGLQLVDFTNLEQHFRNFYGFKEFRGLKLKGVAFVEFEDELKATHCLNELNGTEFEGVTLQINYQKK